MWTSGAPLKYEEKSSASKVALIKINLNSGRRGSKSFRTISRKSGIIHTQLLESRFHELDISLKTTIYLRSFHVHESRPQLHV